MAFALTLFAQATTYPLTTLDYPAAYGSHPFGINESWLVVGTYNAFGGSKFRFIATSDSAVVTIDIEPWFEPNIIGMKLKRVPIPVDILSKSGFDAPKSVDLASLTFGHSGNEKSLAFCGLSSADVNGDKIPDLICFFNIVDAGFQCDDTKGILKG